MIAYERWRQKTQEGWTAQHDDKHTDGSLADAGACYADLAACLTIHPVSETNMETPPSKWPFEASWWKPSLDPIKNLVKAGALIAAEIDRLSRAALKKEG